MWFLISALILVLVILSMMIYDMRSMKETQTRDYNKLINKTNEIVKYCNLVKSQNDILNEAYTNVTKKYVKLYKKYNKTLIPKKEEIIEKEVVDKPVSSSVTFTHTEEDPVMMPHVEEAFPSVIIKRYDMDFLNKIALEKKKENKEWGFYFKARFDKKLNGYKIIRIKEGKVIEATATEIFLQDAPQYTGTIHTHPNRICEMSRRDIFWWGGLYKDCGQELQGIWCEVDKLAFFDRESIYNGVSLKVIIEE